MKFMQKADIVNESKLEEKKHTKVADMSEWALPNSLEIRARALNTSKIVNVFGYGSIAQLNALQNTNDPNLPLGRKKWGQVPGTLNPISNQKSCQQDSVIPKEKESLDSLWKCNKIEQKTKSNKRFFSNSIHESSSTQDQSPNIPIRKKRSIIPRD